MYNENVRRNTDSIRCSCIVILESMDSSFWNENHIILKSIEEEITKIKLYLELLDMEIKKVEKKL